MHVEVLLAAGYAGLLLAVAACLEALARHTAVRSDRYRTAGFTYQPEHDLWVCPRDEPLWPYEVDREHRLVRYRARPSVCNACPVKADCTTSHAGREVVRAVDPWPHSEAGRFHRGVSVALTAVAAAFVLAVTAIHHEPGELMVEAGTGALTGWLMWRWTRDFLRTPSGFPEVSLVRGGSLVPGGDGPQDDAVGPPAAGAGPVLVDLLPPSRVRKGTTWGFDRQPAGRGYRSASGRTGGSGRPGRSVSPGHSASEEDES